MSRVDRMRLALKAIIALGGNLPDDRLTDTTGPNDARARGLMYTEARRLASAALHNEPLGIGVDPFVVGPAEVIALEEAQREREDQP